MRILFDTNILIYREDYKELPSEVAELFKLINTLRISLVIHPLSIQEIENDPNEERRKINLSKITSYPVLDEPPVPNSDFFDSLNIKSNNRHDLIDASLLYAVQANAVDYLITEDKKLYKRAERINLDNRVFNVNEALNFLKNFLVKEDIPAPPYIEYIPVYKLNLEDPFFDSLKKEYKDFHEWWAKISREGRKAWAYFYNKNKIGALLILKIENEPVDCSPPLPKNRRLKICTFKVDFLGYKIGELFIKIAVMFAIRNNLDEIYLTHYTKTEDHLVNLISKFGFEKYGQKPNNEDVYFKRLTIINKKFSPRDPFEIALKIFPSFYDGPNVQKIIVPIRPTYHDRLFIEFKSWLDSKTGIKQLNLFDIDKIEKIPVIPGNAIIKAYLCHTPKRKLKKGDVLLFYRSQDVQAITNIGVLEEIYTIKDFESAVSIIGKRSVYSFEEIKEIVKRPTIILIFRHHFYFPKPIPYSFLIEKNILKGPPQSLVTIDHKSYLILKEFGGIDERYTIS